MTLIFQFNVTLWLSVRANPATCVPFDFTNPPPQPGSAQTDASPGITEEGNNAAANIGQRSKTLKMYFSLIEFETS